MGNDVAGDMEAARRIRAEWLAVLGIDESTAAKMSMVDVPVSVAEEEGFLRLAREMTHEVGVDAGVVERGRVQDAQTRQEANR